MDSGSRWKRPWEERQPSPTYCSPTQPAVAPHTIQPLAANTSGPVEKRALPAFSESFIISPSFRARRPSAPQYLTLEEEALSVDHPPQKTRHLYDASHTKRRRLHDWGLQSPPLVPQTAESARRLVSGKQHEGSTMSLPDEQERLQRTLPQLPSACDAQLDALARAPAIGEDLCCGPSCRGNSCVKRRAVIHDIAAKVDVLHTGIQRILQRNDRQVRSPPDIARLGTDQALAFALEVLRWNVTSLQDLSSQTSVLQPEEPSSQSTIITSTHSSDAMKRTHETPFGEERQPYPRPSPSAGPDASQPTPFTSGVGDHRRPFRSSLDYSSPHFSPPLPPSSTDFAPPPAPSPMHSYQSARMLPSPTSLNFPSGSGLPSIASPAPSLQTSVQITHLQELQHQVSVKTLALQTLQKEYDNLLQRLNRQNTKCAALEKKFEVSDVEVNTLTNDKEDLEARNASLEAQIEELQQSRDDARREVHANSAQYMKILEMASRLQAQSSEDKRKWAKEKTELEAALEAAGAGVEGFGRPRPAVRIEEIISTSPGPNADPGWHADPLCRPEPQIIAALRVEVAQLRGRIHTLEEAVRMMRDEGSKMAEAARMIADAGSKMGESARKALGER